jgi:hypothetical protein
MIVRLRCLETLLVCACLLISSWAHADPSAAEISSARHAFEIAVALEGAGKWADASLKLREALAVKDTPGLRFHLAHCEVEQGKLLEAAADYDRAGELIRHGAKAPDVQKLLAQASVALEARIPRLAIELPSDVPSALPSVDGKVFPPSELALGVPLNPGHHDLLVSAAGRRSFQRSLTLKEGDSVRLRAELPAQAPVTTSAPAIVQVPPMSGAPYEAPREVRRRPSSGKLYLMVGESVVTVVGLVVGLGYHSTASSAADRVSNDQGLIDRAGQGDCRSPSSSEVTSACSDLRTAIDDHDHAALLSTVGFVAAGVGAAAFATTWLVYPSTQAVSAGVTIQPVAGLGRVGLIGRF